MSDNYEGKGFAASQDLVIEDTRVIELIQSHILLNRPPERPDSEIEYAAKRKLTAMVINLPNYSMGTNTETDDRYIEVIRALAKAGPDSPNSVTQDGTPRLSSSIEGRAARS